MSSEKIIDFLTREYYEISYGSSEMSYHDQQKHLEIIRTLGIVATKFGKNEDIFTMQLKENDRLKAENNKLKEDNNRLSTELEGWKGLLQLESIELKEENKRLKEGIDKLLTEKNKFSEMLTRLGWK